MNYYQWKNQIRNFNDSFSKDDELHQKWNRNTKDNIPRFKKENSIWNLEFKYYGKDEKAMILIGSSPSLNRDVKKLREIDENFILVCANSALRFLIKNGIKPHYVICIDADTIDIPKHLDIKESKDITLLASTVVYSKALEKWKGPIYFLPYYSIEDNLKNKVRNRLGKAVPSGGNSITSGLYVVSIIFGARTVVFIGNEYCFDKVRNYYADANASKQEKLKTIFPILDVLGRERWTLPAHYHYAMWTQKVCTDLSPKGYFIDASFGILGKDCPAIHTMELSEAIKKIKWSYEMKKEINNANSEKERLKIIMELMPENEPSQVYRYNVPEYRERLLQFARS